MYLQGFCSEPFPCVVILSELNFLRKMSNPCHCDSIVKQRNESCEPIGLNEGAAPMFEAFLSFAALPQVQFLLNIALEGTSGLDLKSLRFCEILYTSI